MKEKKKMRYNNKYKGEYMKKLKYIFSILLVVVLLTGCEFGTVRHKEEGNKDMRHVKIEVEKYGTIELELDPTEAPITVENFITLAKNGYYDGTTFHRIIKGFMIQGGKGKESGRMIKGEFSDNGVKNNISHTRGTISMARMAGYNDSATTQFFIMHQDTPSIDGQYAAFGHVTKGMEVVDAIAENTPVEDTNGTTLEENQPVIKKVTVLD